MDTPASSMRPDLFTTEFLAATTTPARRIPLEHERALRTAAATASSGSRRDVSAVSVVLALGLDDVDGLKDVVGGIADEFGLLASVRPLIGACAVRFSRRESGFDDQSSVSSPARTTAAQH